jgi:hypothetical protein
MRQTKRWGRSHRRWPPARRAGGAKKAFVLPSNCPPRARLDGCAGWGWGDVGELVTQRHKLLFAHRAPTGPEKLPIRTMVPTNLCLCCARHEYECCVYARLTDRTPDPAFMDPAIRPRCVNFRGRDRRAALKLLRPFQPP